MSVEARPRGGFIILLSLILAMALMMLPMAEPYVRFRPDLLLLVLAYWAMALPHRIGVFTGFFIGLLMDGATSSLTGEHAFIYAFSLWIIVLYHKRLRVTSRWKQTVFIISLLLFEKIVYAVILGITRSTIPDGIFWLSPFIAIFIWPWLFPFLRDLRRRSHIY